MAQNDRVLLADLVRASVEMTATRSRTAKTAVVERTLRAAAPDEVEVVAAFLAGAPRQRRTGLGYRSLETLPEPATEPMLTVLEVDALLERISTTAGVGSRAARTALVAELFGRATAEEQRWLKALVFENLRQGAQDSILLDGIAKAAEVPVTAVRRAAMFTPWSGEVAAAALSGGREALDAFGLVPGRPVRPMLAASAPDVAAALEKMAAACVVDRKLDGIRVQVHRVGGEVRVYTRSLDDVTERLPEVVEAALALAADPVVLDGEVLALAEDGRPRPFQETASRTGSSVAVEELRRRTPLTVYFFDVLHRDGEDLLDADGATRLARLDETVPERYRVPRVVTSSPEEAQAFFDATVAAGHEGVVVKALDSPYLAGRRGAGWVKVKPRHTLDLVVLAVEWGSGRRSGWLSNIHLGARDPEGGGYVMLGKTFKGMTDEMLAWQTERFLSLETSREGHVVHVRPEQVVEIAFDGIQTSSRYPGGMALRFARVLRYRDDKTADEADTVETVRALR
ncbi:ATP-dependent DNA ligase [Nocardioides caldifontis]|uniref:ATP-dependent DNA ligase n=1 Tax=Nocardioides caldifontis TaxID=2588938 RepID=UPI0019397DBB|nr:ATP-dependent DNA ligase [Nocardioides caldifontis]